MPSKAICFFIPLCNMLDTNKSSLEPQPSSRESGMERSSFDPELAEGEGRQGKVRSKSISWDVNEIVTSEGVTKDRENNCALPLDTRTRTNSYPYTQNCNLFDPFLNAADGQKYICVLGPPCLSGLQFRSVTVKQKPVPFNAERFICRPALGCNDPQLEVEMSDFDQELFKHNFKNYRMKHCRGCCCRLSRCSCTSLSTSSMQTSSIKRSSESSRFSSSLTPSLFQVKLDHLKGTCQNRVPVQKVSLFGVAPATVANRNAFLGRNNCNCSTKERSSHVENRKWLGHVVHVQGDGRCLFRSLAVTTHDKLQKCKRDEYGRPDNDDDEDKEKEMADDLRSKVVSFMKDNLHFYSQLENELINADQPTAKRFGKFKDRLEAMSMPHTMPGELELNAASCVLEQIIVVLNTDLDIISVYGDDRYPESRTLTVRFTRLGEDVGHYDAVVLHNDQERARNNECFRRVVHELQKKVSVFNRLIEYITRLDVNADMEKEVKDMNLTNIDPRTGRFNQLHTAQKFGTNNNKSDIIIAHGLKAQASVSASTQTSETDCVEKRPVRRRQRRKPTKSNKKRKTGRARKRKPNKVVRDRNYNRRSSRTRQKRARSSDSDVSCERQRKYRKTAATARKSKPCPRSNRAAKTKRGQKSSVKRTKRRAQVRTGCVRYVLVNPKARSVKDASELDINRHNSFHLPDALAGGIQRCFMCQKCVDADMSSTLLKCYLCGRFAHKECAVRESPAWGHGQVEDNYFLCSECVPQ